MIADFDTASELAELAESASLSGISLISARGRDNCSRQCVCRAVPLLTDRTDSSGRSTTGQLNDFTGRVEPGVAFRLLLFTEHDETG